MTRIEQWRKNDPTDRGADLLAVGFGASTVLWAVAYIGLSPAVNAPALLMAVIVLAGLVAAGWVIGRWTARGVSGGVKLGLLLGAVNFLIIASLHGKDRTTDAMLFGVKWIVGFTLIAVCLAAGGAALGAIARGPQRPIAWSSWFAAIVAVTVLPLLVSGGIVTGLEAGLAVPDWLTTFGYPMMFYPMAMMQEDSGVYAEHFHRLWGLLVGLSVLVLMVQLWRVDHRRWVRWLGAAVLLSVIVQGLLGGPGRVLQAEIWYAIVHGVFGQIVFAAIAIIAAATSITWLSSRAVEQRGGAGTDHTATTILVVLLLIQLGLGAVYRHLRRDAGDPMHGIHAMYTHIVVAMLVTGVLVFVGGRAWARYRDLPCLPRLGQALIGLVGLQLLLGIAALIAVLLRGKAASIPLSEVALTTAHQATGALLLALAALAWVWSRRLLFEPVPQTAQVGHPARSAPPSAG